MTLVEESIPVGCSGVGVPCTVRSHVWGEDPCIVRPHVHGWGRADPGRGEGEVYCIMSNVTWDLHTPENRLTHTHATENIMFPQLCWRTVKMSHFAVSCHMIMFVFEMFVQTTEQF